MADSLTTTETQTLGEYAVRQTNTNVLDSPHHTVAKADRPNRKFLGLASLRNLKARPKPVSSDDDLTKLKTAVQESHQVLDSAKSVFPLMLFPDEISIDRHKLTIIYRTFFKTAQTVSVELKSVKNVQVDLGPAFGTLTVTSDNFINNVQKVESLKRSDATRLQRLIQGAMVACRDDIDINKINTPDLLKLLHDLGK